MNSLLLKNILLDGERRDILVEGNRIRRIADDIAHPADRVLDGGGRLAAVPPFFNVHTHAAMTLLRGYADDMELFTWLNDYIWPAEARLTPEDIYHGTRLAILEMIRTGTVFFSDMYWHQKEAIRAAVEMGVRAAIGLLYIAGPDGRLLERNRRANAELLELLPPGKLCLTEIKENDPRVVPAFLEEIDRAGKFDAQKAKERNIPLKYWSRLQAGEMIETEEEMDDMTEELIDRFGDIPKKVQQLLHIAALKGLAHSAYVTAVEQKGEEFKFTMYEKAKIDPRKIPALLQSYRNSLVFKTEEPPYFLYRKTGRSGKDKGEDILALLRKILEDIRSLHV